MTGILYWTFGEANLKRLSVSLFSLRQVYGGPVCILHEGLLPQHYQYFFWKHNADCRQIEESREYVFVKKARIWKYSPFKATLYLDSDTIIQKPIDELLRCVEAHKMVLANHPTFGPNNYRRIRKRLELWRTLFPEMHKHAISIKAATNGGVVGWTSQQSMQDAEALTEIGYKDGRPMKRVVDEMALTLVGARDALFVDSKWNSHPNKLTEKEANILHFYNERYVESTVWNNWGRQIHL